MLYHIHMIFTPSKVSILQVQRTLELTFYLLLPFVVFSFTQNMIYTFICLIFCIIAIYFGTIILFMQKIIIEDTRLTFNDAGFHHPQNYLNRAKKVSTNEYTIDLSKVDRLFAKIETNGRYRFISFYNGNIPKNSNNILYLNKDQKNLLLTIAGLWTEHDIQKIITEAKKINSNLPHLVPRP